ncbi:PepSY-like domain-containing protein [Sphingobacterium sp. SYP-B4668]|uniref:PepSY-like domain-containing protein n=1 Tax=Sphingobacterium sp. SYP-B4668 TaxID=2996035 RepID=UPI0005327282|nr:PepSY-like domain-containing protein [Sphingobacterium sp. SYP-B4668]
MKNLILALMLLFSIQAIYAQDIKESQVPAVILNAYKLQFKNAKLSEWEIKHNGVYEVDFKTSLTGKDHTALYTPEGKLVSYKQEITAKQLPREVKDAIKKEFKGFRIDDVDRYDQQGKVTYKVGLKNSPQEYEVVFSASGAVISKKID